MHAHRLTLSFPTVYPLWHAGWVNRFGKRGGLSPIKVIREVAAELSLVVAGPLKEGGLWSPVRLELVKE